MRECVCVVYLTQDVAWLDCIMMRKSLGVLESPALQYTHAHTHTHHSMRERERLNRHSTVAVLPGEIEGDIQISYLAGCLNRDTLFLLSTQFQIESDLIKNKSYQSKELVIQIL